MPCCPSATNTVVAEAPRAHVHLHTRNLGASIAFYRNLFGSDPVKVKPGYAKFLPTWAPVNLALSESDAQERGNAVSHLGIQVATKEEVTAQLKRIQAEGLAVRVEMNVDCCHANQDKFWVRDPSGVEWEVYYLNYDIEDSPVTCATTACCPQ